MSHGSLRVPWALRLVAAILVACLALPSGAFSASVCIGQNHPRHRWLEMRERKCDISGARKNSKAMLISKSDVRTRTTQGVNLQWKKLWWEEGNKYVHVRIAARTLKTIRLKGLDATAKRYGVDLNKFSISYGSKAAATAAHSDGDAAKRQEVAASKAA